MIAWSFPPEAEVGALRTARFCRFLPEFGIEPIVLTADLSFYKDRDATWPVPEGIRVERTPVLATPLDWYAKWKGRSISKSVSATGNPVPAQKAAPRFLKRQLLTALQTPDRYWGWYFPAVRAATEILQREKINVLFSSGPPWISHLIGRKLQRNFQIPWIADFRDPWAYGMTWNLIPSWKQWLDKRLMESCICEADRVICNTERFRARLIGAFPQLPEQRFVTITNGINEGTPGLPYVQSRAQTLLLHLGSLYGGRRIETFCHAVRELVANKKLDPQTFKVLFVGDMDPSLSSAGEQAAPDLVKAKIIEFRSRVKWDEAQNILATADQLLLFFDEPLAVPAKFYEYLQTGKPILAICKPGALTDALAATGAGTWADPDDSQGITSRILQLCQMQRRTPADVQNSIERYGAKTLTACLANVIHDLAPARTQPEQPVPIK
jgi:hypothetical protein